MRCCLTIAVVLCFAVNAPAEAPPKPADATVRFTLHPALSPTPALKYLFLPDLDTQTPGNAMTCYSRAMLAPGSNISLKERDKALRGHLDLPIDKLAVEQARKDLEPFAGMLRETAIGAHRRHFTYDLDFRKEGYYLLLPELLELRNLSVPLALQARIHIAAGEHDKALETLQTGYALARHAADGPTLIMNLVGIAIANRVTDGLEELVQRPGSPNLYWALTALPHPFIGIQTGLEGEKVLPFRDEMPRISVLAGRPLSSEQVGKLFESTFKLMCSEGDNLFAKNYDEAKKLVAEIVERDYDAAKAALVKGGRKPAELAPMSKAQVVALYSLETYVQWRDEIFKWSHVPYWQSEAPLEKVSAQVAETKKLGLPFAGMLLPSHQKVYLRVAGLERRLTALRVVEALRLYAATHGGELPESLADIKDVPIPEDPVTGKPFGYQREGNKAKLTGATPKLEAPTKNNTIAYEITMERK